MLSRARAANAGSARDVPEANSPSDHSSSARSWVLDSGVSTVHNNPEIPRTPTSATATAAPVRRIRGIRWPLAPSGFIHLSPNPAKGILRALPGEALSIREESGTFAPRPQKLGERGKSAGSASEENLPTWMPPAEARSSASLRVFSAIAAIRTVPCPVTSQSRSMSPICCGTCSSRARTSSCRVALSGSIWTSAYSIWLRGKNRSAAASHPISATIAFRRPSKSAPSILSLATSVHAWSSRYINRTTDVSSSKAQEFRMDA